MVHTVAPWIDPELIEAERRSITDSAFARLWQNRWTQPEDALVNADDLAAAAVLDGPVAPVPGVRYVTALDVGLVNDRTVLVVCHKEGMGESERVILDRLWRWQGSRRKPVDLREVEETIVEAQGRYPGEVLADPFQAVQLLQSLTKRGVSASKFDFTTASVGRLAGSLLRALRSRRISLPNDPVLLEELAGVRIVENAAGVPRLDHDAGQHDDQAVAIALPVHRLTDLPPAGGPLNYSDEEWATFGRHHGQTFVPLLVGTGFAADTSLGMPTEVDTSDNGKTVRSPFT
jgi:hypothetical protein